MVAGFPCTAMRGLRALRQPRGHRVQRRVGLRGSSRVCCGRCRSRFRARLGHPAHAIARLEKLRGDAADARLSLANGATSMATETLIIVVGGDYQLTRFAVKF